MTIVEALTTETATTLRCETEAQAILRKALREEIKADGLSANEVERRIDRIMGCSTRQEHASWTCTVCGQNNPDAVCGMCCDCLGV
jgi:hypothetical protein